MGRALAVLVPSRGRPGNAARLLEAMEATCRGDTRLVLGLDADDPTLHEYQALGCETVVRPGLRHQLVGWVNLLALDRTERFVGHIGDDNVPRTVGWDVRVMDSLQDHMFCFPDDLDPGREPGTLSLHIFMRRTVVERLGYMGPPEIQHMYVDPVWFAWGQATSIQFLSDVVVEHMHYSFGKAPHDESYGHSTGLIPRDCAAYNAYCRDRMNDDILKLGGEPYTPEGIGEFNRRLNIPEVWGR